MSLSNRLGLPTEAIRGIANKAADMVLLQMPQVTQKVLKWLSVIQENALI